jgi:hypothetical protein
MIVDSILGFILQNFRNFILSLRLNLLRYQYTYRYSYDAFKSMDRDQALFFAFFVLIF